MPPVLLDIDETDLKTGVLGLVVALVEIIKEVLRLQAIKRMEAGSLTEAEVERLGEALLDLEEAIEQIKVEMGIAQSVKAIRGGLDRAVDDAVESLAGVWGSGAGGRGSAPCPLWGNDGTV